MLLDRKQVVYLIKVNVFLKKNDLDLVCRAHQVIIIYFKNYKLFKKVVEDGYEFFSKR